MENTIIQNSDNVEIIPNETVKIINQPKTNDEIRGVYLYSQLTSFCLSKRKHGYIKNELKKFDLKACSKCKLIKDIYTDFYWLNKPKNIRSSSCKSCITEKNKMVYSTRLIKIDKKITDIDFDKIKD